MSVSAELSDNSPRHRFGRKSALKKSAVSHSDFDEPEDLHFQDQNGQRSSSVCAGANIPPRMAQLETLEAKMASIEVSLSMTPRRRKSSSIGGRCVPLPSSAAGLTSTNTQPPPPTSKDMPDPLRGQFKDKENIIQSLKEQLCSTMNMTRLGGGVGSNIGQLQPPLAEGERRAVEERVATLRSDMEGKRAAIKGLKAALERLDITDNIDIRIQQAELEYQLGREELELLTLLEQSRALQVVLEQDDNAKTKQDQHTIYSCIDGSMVMTLHAVQVEYDPKSPQFGAGARIRNSGLWVEWALEHTGMCKGDRLLEVNGKLVLSKSKEDMLRLLCISPSPAQLVVLRSRPLEGPESNGNRVYPHSALAQMGSLRAELNALREQAEEARRTKDGLRSDNLRLTHRITYLEEQVAELLERNKEPDNEVQIVIPPKVTSTVNTQKNVTNINITSEPNPKTSQPKSDVQVFQKGPDVTAIVANIPGLEIGGKDTAEASASLPIIRPRSNQSNVSSTQIAIGGSPKSNESKSSYSVELNDVAPKHVHSHFNTNHVHFNHKTAKINNSRYSLQPSKSSNSLDYNDYDTNSNIEIKPYSIRQSQSHHSIYKNKDYKNYDYNSETSAAIEIIKKNQKQYFDKNYKNTKVHGYNSKALSDDNSEILKSYKREHKKASILEYFDRGMNINKKATKKIIEDLKHSNDKCIEKNKQESFTNTNKSSAFNKRLSKYENTECFDFHPDRDYIDHRIDGKVIQNAHKSSRRLSKLHSKTTKSVDCDSEPTQNVDEEKYRKSRMKILDYTSEPNSIHGHYKKHYQNLERPRPTPPKKPLRLSLHRAQSMQSVELIKPSSDTFYLHDPIQRQSSANDVASKDECKFSISSNNNNINGLFQNSNDDYRIKPESSYSRNEGNQLTVKFSLDEDHKHGSQSNISEKKVKKRTHNGKITSSERLALYNNGNESDRNGGYSTSRSESLSPLSKSSHTKSICSNSKENLQNGVNSIDITRYTPCKDRSRAEMQIKSNRNNISDYSKVNGYSNYDKNESASESSRTPSRAESCHSGFRWPSSSVFKNMKVDSSRTNGHMSDGSKK